jgi:hypothetical protein
MYLTQYFIMLTNGKYSALVIKVSFSIEPFNKKNVVMHLSHFDQFFIQSSFF